MCHFIIFDSTNMSLKKTEDIFWSVDAGFYAVYKVDTVQYFYINPLVLQFSMSFLTLVYCKGFSRCRYYYQTLIFHKQENICIHTSSTLSKLKYKITQIIMVLYFVSIF